MQHKITEMTYSTRKLGNAFTWLGWIIGLLLLMLLFNRILGDRQNPNRSIDTVQNAGQQQVELKRNRQGHYVFNGFINGQKVTFMIDTGATTTSIPLSLGERLGLRKGFRYQVQTANGVSSAWSTRIDSLRIGDMEFNNVEASLNPGYQGNEILLGMNVLKNIEMIQRGDSLILRK